MMISQFPISQFQILNYSFLFFPLSFFLIGLCLGSFINMAIYRTKHKKNFGGFSFCDFCKKPLKFVDLIPVFSFINSKGRSRCCNKKLDKTMPVVEIITGISYLILSYLFLSGALGFTAFGFWLVISPILVFTFFYDLKYFEIPVVPVVVGYISWFFIKIFEFVSLNNSLQYTVHSTPLGRYLEASGFLDNQLTYFKEDILWTLGFALFVFLFFLFLFLITKGKGMGFGDVYFAPLLALIVEYPASPIFLASSFITGAVVGVGLILLKGKNLKTAVPFGPFLIIGLIIALTFKNFLYTL